MRAYDGSEDDPFDEADGDAAECVVALSELSKLSGRLTRLEAKELAHRHAGRLDSLAYDLAYVEGLADALAIMQGREPSRPDPVAR